jgi:dipeptidyl-peptidase III
MWYAARMRRGGRLGWAGMSAGLATACLACRSAAPKGASAPAAPPQAASTAAPLPAFAPQPANRLADVSGIAVLALAAPQFANLPRDQRLVAHFAARAAAAGDPIAAEQGYRHNLSIIRLLRGILGRPQVVQAPLLARIRGFARLVYLNHGLHDPETGRKQRPGFTAAELRTAALAASAAGADLGLSGRSVEYALRALEGPLFDPRVDAQRTVHGADLTASAVNFYEGVTLKDLESFPERAPLHSRLVKQGGVVSERIYRLPAAADALDRALPWTAPPQRAAFEALSAFFRSGDPAQFEAAQRAWTEAFGPVDAFLGFLDRSADPRGRKALFSGVVGMADPERTAALERVRLRNSGESLFLLAASGTSRPPQRYALTVETKSALLAAPLEAAAQFRSESVISALAEPPLVLDLLRCAPALRFAQLALRELSRDRVELSAVLEEALAHAHAHLLAQTTPELLPDPRCRELWPQFVVTDWLASAASAADGDRIEDDAQRAVQLQIWWFTGKGALLERHIGGRRYLTVPDPGRFRAAAQELLALLQQIQSAGDAARWRELLERHASRVDPQWRDDVVARLQGVPRRVAVLPPRLDAVLDADGKVVDAQAVPVPDLDEEMLRDWSTY